MFVTVLIAAGSGATWIANLQAQMSENRRAIEDWKEYSDRTMKDLLKTLDQYDTSLLHQIDLDRARNQSEWDEEHRYDKEVRETINGTVNRIEADRKASEQNYNEALRRMNDRMLYMAVTKGITLPPPSGDTKAPP